MDDDDDDFEDLFSFGASTTTPAPPTERTKTPTSTFSDYDILNDVSTPGGVIGAHHVPGAAGAGAATGQAMPAGTVGAPTPRVEQGDDDFDALFGTPPVTPDTSRSPMEVTSTQPSSMDASAAAAAGGGGLLPPPIDDSPTTNLHHESLSIIDDFHVHDEETRDMLEWLDDDNTGKKTKDDSYQEITSNMISSGDGDDNTNNLPYLKNDDDDDDFDFDQMLADVDVASSPKRAVNDGTKASDEREVQDVESEVALKFPEPTNTFDSIPTSFSNPPLSASIEKELSLDQWDDDNEVAEDLQVSDGGIDTQHEMTVTSSEGTDMVGSSPGHEGAIVAKAEPITLQKKTYFSLSEAIRSNLSTAEDVRSLFARERGVNNENSIGISKEDRAHLWAKIVCGKVLEDIENGSLAESYREWDSKWEIPNEFEGGEFGVMIHAILNEGCGTSIDDDHYEAKKRQLMSVSYFQCCNKSTSTSSLGIDSLIPPVALAILDAGLPPASASVVLSHIEPSAMPLLRLAHEERYSAAKALHSEFYLLACYHLPLLVMHLDRHCPGWYWPKETSVHLDKGNTSDNPDEQTHVHESGNGENANEGGDALTEESTLKDQRKSDLDQNGLVPLSWFVTNFAGEFGGSCLNHNILLQLWDNILTEGDHSWKYFLAIAVLDKKSDLLLMSRGDELKRDLEKILNLQEDKACSESFFGSSEGKQEPTNCDEMARDWLAAAKSLMESTPSSVIELLRSADDRAVASAITVRQTKLDQELRAQLEEHEEAQRKEREERRRESDRELNKARLIAYYRTYNPEKVDTIDQILKLFDGRMEVLNEKLTKKYGKGFIPEEALKDHTRSFLTSINQSIKETRKHVSDAMSVQRKKSAKVLTEIRSHTPVVLEVSATEVIPVICTTKFHHLSTGQSSSPSKLASCTGSNLHFYLVDCRPESIALEQGRFPTAVTLSPEKLQDPDELQKLTDMFESLRGTVHVCVMGEGFSSFPVLYNHALSKAEEKLLDDDVARTSNCALFFLKKGFPFVSVLRGGFAAAHAFLSRNGHERAMGPDQILVDYDPDNSLFAQLEAARQEEDKYKNAPAREKTARTLQKIIDNSMVRLTLEEQRLNSLANELAKPETVDKMKQSVSNFLAKPKSSIGFGTKTTTLTKADEATSSTNSQQQEDSGNTTSTVMNFKLPFLYSDSSSIALSTRGSAIDEEDNGTNADPKQENSLDSAPPPTAEKDQFSATESASKISSAFTSFTQRIQQSTTDKESTIEGNLPANDVPGSKFSFSSLRNVSSIGKSTASHLPPNEEEKVNNPSTESSADAPLIPQHKSSDTTKSTISMSSFTKKLKFGQQSADQKSADATRKVDEPKKDNPPAKHAEGWKFSKLTKSMGESISELREKAVVSKSTDEIKDNVTNAATKGKEDGGSFTKFSMSVSGSFSGIRKQPFGSLMQFKPDSAGAKSSSGEESDISKKLVALGKFLTEDEPRPKTRFQREAEEEAISFDDESAGTTTVSTEESNEGDKQTTMFSGPDPERHDSPSNDMFADISLSSSDENPQPMSK